MGSAKYEGLKSKLSDERALTHDPFGLLAEITAMVNNASTHDEGRDLVIRSLAVADKLPKAYDKLLAALVRNVGLFPYMKERLKAADTADLLAYELHRTGNPDSEIVFHTLQARIFHQLVSKANVVVSASTSAGKSAVVDELLATRTYKKVVIIVPTIALIDETRRRLLKRFYGTCHVITHPTQSARDDLLNVYVLTQERVRGRADLVDVDLLVVDEFYKMNLDTDDDPDRAIDLNLAFNQIASTGAQFYLLGPNIQAIKGLQDYDYHFIHSDFSTVAVDVINFDLPSRGPERPQKLLELCKGIDEPTIIYCQSPSSASQVATLLAESGVPDWQYSEDAVEWISENYDPEWSVVRALSKGIGIHHGGVPRALQQYFIRQFNAKRLKYLVCTSTIIEGVNTVAKNVIIYDRRKNKGVLEHFTYKNIEGRAGRMNQYFVGKVFALELAPDDQNMLVEYPLGLQDDHTPMGLLLDLATDELTELSKGRVEDYLNSSTLSPETLRANRYVGLDVQEAIASDIRSNLDEYRDVLHWSGAQPTAAQLEAVCELIFTHLSARTLQDYGVFSGRQLSRHLNGLRINKDLSAWVQEQVRTRKPSDDPSDAVELALKFVRNVVCQRFPKDVMVIDAIQRDVFGKKGMASGDYSSFAGQAEHMFVNSLIFSLDEYGIPIQTAQKLQGGLLPAKSLDKVLRSLVALDLADYDLLPFEEEILADVRGTLAPIQRPRRVR